MCAFSCAIVYLVFLFFHVLKGKGEFTMEYLEHNTISQDVQMQLVNAYKLQRAQSDSSGSPMEKFWLQIILELCSVILWTSLIENT
jgi:hypothetical protein